MLLPRILEVDTDARITTFQMSQHFWLTKMGEFPLPDKKGVNLTEEMELELATIMREKLELHHLTPTAILDYVKSRSGCSGRTAGCFNILAQEKKRLLVGQSSGTRVNRSNNEQALAQLAPSVKRREDNWTNYNREGSTRVSNSKEATVMRRNLYRTKISTQCRNGTFKTIVMTRTRITRNLPMSNLLVTTEYCWTGLQPKHFQKHVL